MFSFAGVCSREDVYKRAQDFARQIIFDLAIKGFDGCLRRITAVEFYLHIPRLFEDGVCAGGATHQQREQLNRETFYIHTRRKNQGKELEKSFAAPNRAGMDITCGDNRKIFGGILIRELDENDGPSLALRSIIRGNKGLVPIPRESDLNVWNKHEKEILCSIDSSNIWSGGPVRLVPRKIGGKLWCGPRQNIQGTVLAKEMLQFSNRPKNKAFVLAEEFYK
ncbi:MAG: hypothetical protein WCG27_10755 [Pseudomonadota bacterium]